MTKIGHNCPDCDKHIKEAEIYPNCPNCDSSNFVDLDDFRIMFICRKCKVEWNQE